MPNVSRWAVALAWSALAAGCAVGPNYSTPQVALPGAFSGAADVAPTTAPATTGPAAPVDLSRWWASLGDPELDSLVRRAVEGNFDLRIAVERLQEARAAEFVATGGAIGNLGATPGIDLSAAAGRGTGTNTTRGRIAPPLNAASNTTGLKEITEIVGFDASWEFDFAGRFRRIAEAAAADTQAVAEARNQVLVTLIADVVRGYVEVRGGQFRLELARQNVATQQRTLNVVQVRLRQGLGNELDVALAQRQYSASLAKIAPLAAALASAERRVAVLTGRYPDDLRAELDRPASLPATPPQVAPGMPVELLRRRPDIRRIERELAASTARIGVATGDLFPRLAVTGGVGFQGQDLGRSPDVTKMIWSVGPSLYWPFLDFGRLDSAVQAQDYRTRQALLAYQRAIITSVQEVDDALGSYAAQQDQLAQLGDAVRASKRAETLATQRYNNGLTDFLNVLDAQRQLYDLEDQYAVAQASLIREFVALYKALGGGWEGYEAPAPPPPPMPAVVAAAARTARPATGAP